MAHLAIFAFILSLPIGVIAVYRSFQAYKRFDQRYLFTYGAMLIFLNLAVILSLVNNYIFTNLFVRYASNAAIISESIYRFLASLVDMGFAWVFVVFCRKLLMKKLTTLFKVLYFGTGIPLLLALIFYFVYSLVTVNLFPILTVNLIVIFLTENVIMFTILYLLRRNKIILDKGKQKAIRVLGQAMLYSFALVMIFSLLLAYRVVSNSALVLSTSVFLAVLYSLPVFYLKPFMETYHGPLETIKANVHRVESLYKKYGISQREQEVTRLICDGKTNKQIEDELFIALQTVKDHVSRIYQKVGVKNRVQLTNIFRNKD
jgi:DNA-binding CsgD family transcriptional regulator